MQAEILLTLELQQRLFASPRRVALLKHIAHTGSISRGAKQAGISYKSAWDAINEMNQLSDNPLVECSTGGKGGGGAQITTYGRRLIQLYDLLAQIQQKAFDVLSQDDLPLNSLLAAISRFSLQTSARNQWFGTVLQLDTEGLQPRVDVLLANSETRITAIVTAQSAQRLGLVPGKEVLVLIKASWVQLAHQPAPDADNQLQGVITQLQQDKQRSEVISSLPGGRALCATLPATQCTSLSLQPGITISAFFNADRVIIATLC